MAAGSTIRCRDSPQVSVVMPAYNAERFIRFAIRSALAQTLRDLELIVIDDGSSDATVAIVEEEAALDPRVVLLRMERNSGPGAARNRGFTVGRGRWIALLDSDDLMAPDRLERLIDLGERLNTDMVADNLVRFASLDGALIPHLAEDSDFTLDAARYLRLNLFYEGSHHHGLLQPVIRTEALRRSGQAYNEQLRMMSDDELHVRLLLEGLRMHVHNRPTYFYRLHEGGISQGLPRRRHVADLLEASRRVLAHYRSKPVADLLVRRCRAFERAIDYLDFIAALKQRDGRTAFRLARARPSILPLLRTPIGNVLSRFGSAAQVPGRADLRAGLEEAMRLAGEAAPASP